MNLVSKYILMLFITFNMFASKESFAEPNQTKTKIESSNGSGLAYIFATGPYLFDPTTRTHIKGRRFYTTSWNKEYDSKYAKSIVDSLITKVQLNYPEARTFHVKDFSKDSLAKIYENLRTQLPELSKVILVITAHGYIEDGNFYILNYGEPLSGKELGSLTSGIFTETILFTCHSGAADVNDFSGPVFGASLRHTGTDAEHFYYWAEFVQRTKEENFPSNAREFHDSWWRSRIEQAVYKINSNPIVRLWNWWYQVDLMELIREENEKILSDGKWVRSHPFWYSPKNFQASQ